MSIVSGSQVYNIIDRVMGIMNSDILDHGQIVSYIFYKMLLTNGCYSNKDLAEYAMIGLLHDIGIMKTGYKMSLATAENSNIWGHSIYGYLFLKYLSPADDKAEIVLYHHLDYNKHKYIKSEYIDEAACLSLADKMDMFMRESKVTAMDRDYFQKNKNITFSETALKLFNRAQEKYNITSKLATGEYKQELENLFDEANFSDEYIRRYLQMIVYSIDFRSQQTVLHALGTTTFAECIGKLMGIRGRQLEELYYGALLHDIGKIAIPLNILEAPRRLTDEEMRIMKAHVLITERILDGVIDKRIFEIAIRHHEKVDGTGYPRGLSGEELGLQERVMAVADILSALYGKRSYKDSMPKEKILAIISEDGKSGKLCNKVVSKVIERYDSILQYYDSHMTGTQRIYMLILEQYDKIYDKFKRFEKI